jgi:hypothetical protein
VDVFAEPSLYRTDRKQSHWRMAPPGIHRLRFLLQDNAQAGYSIMMIADTRADSGCGRQAQPRKADAPRKANSPFRPGKSGNACWTTASCSTCA